MHLQEKTLKSDIIYEGPIFTITHDVAELENGKNLIVLSANEKGKYSQIITDAFYKKVK